MVMMIHNVIGHRKRLGAEKEGHRPFRKYDGAEGRVSVIGFEKRVRSGRWEGVRGEGSQANGSNKGDRMVRKYDDGDGGA